ncbi:lactam utilization protein LamB [Ammoniphilus oxalaticus]|uniref:5-oxoprolinase subunit A n=2 Tax=Ammoniphilus oxalaticus TaxID=66863 RepID=A0A419SEY9_9BACL|nr:lactam utilization protein LamB [Ammoniphilus oxalaticus]
MGNDEEIMKIVTSANIACGFHAGDPTTMRRAVKLALANDIAIGAHPSLPDLVGFGRRNIAISPEEAYDLVVYQIGALAGFVRAEGGILRHVKPHGALYNMAAADKGLAMSIAKAVYRIDPQLVLFGLSGSELVKAGDQIGLQVAHEVFADRTYQENGMLTSRQEADSLITDDQQAAKQVIRLVKEGKVRSVQGKDVELRADTICIHGDGAQALSLAQTIRQSLEAQGIRIQSIN